MADGINQEEQKESGAQSEETQKTEENQFVDRKAYEQVTKDMHKFKNEYKELQAKLAEYETQKSVEEEQKLLEEKKYQELLSKREQELEAERKERETLANRVQNAERVNALKKEGVEVIDSTIFQLPEIQKALGTIDFDSEGNIDSEKAKQVANYLRENKPHFLKQSQGAEIPADAPGRGNVSGKISYDNWLKLPAGERKARMKDIDPSSL